jgi:23S rRNA (uracil1939-C5)-methyltransferase
MPDIEIEKLVYGGEGLARLEGQVVLVPRVLPGEHVSVTTERVKTGLLRGTVAELQQPSPERIVPECEYFGICGGCQYQHARYSFQLEQKRAILLENLQRQGGLKFEGDIETISGEPWAYRNRIQLHFEPGECGFHRLGSNELEAINHCPISSPMLSDAIKKISEAVRQPEWPRFLKSLELFSNEQEIQLNILDSTRPIAARFFEWSKSFLPFAPGALDYSACDYTFRISRGSFFQVNRFLIEKLVAEVLGDETGETAIDLYAGVGLFSLPLSRRFQSVQAVERGGPAVRDLEYNAVHADITNIMSVRASAEDFLRRLTAAPDLIIVDPPRSGLGKDATAELLRVKPRRLTIVSCDPATLARDLKLLLEGFEIAKMSLVDLFPQTYHLETVVHLMAK